MTALPLVITTAGLARFTAAQVDDDIDLGISSVGLTNQTFVAAPTLTALPGQFRSVATISGEAVGGNIVHMIVRDAAELSYTVRGFGLFLEDGTLFAVYGQDLPIFEKSAAATMLLTLDLAFPTADVSSITFGDTNFLNPPATSTTRGVVELATEAEAVAGDDEERAVTPAVMKAAIAAALAAMLPVGFIGKFYGDAADVPTGWAICNGQTVPRSDGAGTITTPDYRNHVAIGASDDLDVGDIVGAFSKTANSAAAGGHVPAATLADASTGITLDAPLRSNVAGGGSGTAVDTATLDDPGHTHVLTMEPVEDHLHEVTIDVTQPSLAVHFIMRV